MRLNHRWRCKVGGPLPLFTAERKRKRKRKQAKKKRSRRGKFIDFTTSTDNHCRVNSFCIENRTSLRKFSRWKGSVSAVRDGSDRVGNASGFPLEVPSHYISRGPAPPIPTLASVNYHEQSIHHNHTQYLHFRGTVLLSDSVTILSGMLLI
jgi:hypothetical protein